MDYAAWENVVFGYHPDTKFQSGLFMNNAAIKEDAAGKMERFDVRPQTRDFWREISRVVTSKKLSWHEKLKGTQTFYW